MKTKIILLFVVAMLAPCALTFAQTEPPAVPTSPGADSGTTSSTDEKVDLVAFDNTGLEEAVRTLARQAGINLIFDPKVLDLRDAAGNKIALPSVSIRFEHVSAMQALLALMDNYNWQMIQDPKSKISRITAKDPAALDPLTTVVVQLKYSNPTNIIAEIGPTISSRSRMIADMRTSQIIISATEKELISVDALIQKLDTATKQVLIEAKILETTKDPSSKKGIDWTSTLAAQNVFFGNGFTSGTVNNSSTASASGGSAGTPGLPGSGGASNATSLVTGLITSIGSGGFSADTARGINPATAFLNADGVHAVLSFLNSDSETESISLPRTIALDGVPTELAVVRNIPVFEQQQTAGVGGGQALATVKPNYNLSITDGSGANAILNEVGVKLKVTPRIVGGTNVFMDLKPEVSQREVGTEKITLGNQTSESPIFNRRKIITQATVPSGYTLVLGGLSSDSIAKNFTKVPGLGDMPFLGSLFRSNSKEHLKTTILIFVTPTIIQDSDFQMSHSQFLKTKDVPRPDLDETPWDSGKPVDWTKPKTKVEPFYEGK